MTKKITAALVGNPNCGKTTLFNQLTGSNQYVGNWSGVTVEKKAGTVKGTNKNFEIVDLPGIYSLYPYSMEEIVARDFIINENPDFIINIIDGTNIERNLYLTLQLTEIGKPVIMAINMIDEVEAKGGKINFELLKKTLGIEIVPISAKKGTNLEELIQKSLELKNKPFSPKIIYDFATTEALEQIKDVLKKAGITNIPPDFAASKLLEGDKLIKETLTLSTKDHDKVEKIAKNYEMSSKYGDRETMLADARYKFITSVTDKTVKKLHQSGEMTLSDKIDKFLTNKYLAMPIFMFVMFLMFNLTFGRIGTFLSDGIDYLIIGQLGDLITNFLSVAQTPEWTRALLVDAVIGGVGGVLKFLPQISILFLCLSVLEDSGYMARAAFITDRLLSKLGLSGKSFIPMLMGFGCTTPAVMAARTLENEKDRRLTIMITPFMSCGARLPIYALFAGIFFEENQGLIVFSMYVIGLLAAIISGIILKKLVFKGEAPPFVMELPPYRMPGIKSVFRHTWEKAKGFIIKAGTVIFSMSIIIWILQNFNFDFQMVADSSQSIFANIGRWIAPIFTPLGFGTWQASVALLAGLVAKEAVVSTMILLYSAESAIALSGALFAAFTPLSAFAFMTFCLLYMPCISAFITIKKEMNSAKWTFFAVAWQMGFAYIVSLLIYQIGSLFI